jgi:hypothetical protein
LLSIALFANFEAAGTAQNIGKIVSMFTEGSSTGRTTDLSIFWLLRSALVGRARI